MHIFRGFLNETFQTFLRISSWSLKSLILEEKACQLNGNLHVARKLSDTFNLHLLVERKYP